MVTGCVLWRILLFQATGVFSRNFLGSGRCELLRGIERILCLVLGIGTLEARIQRQLAHVRRGVALLLDGLRKGGGRQAIVRGSDGAARSDRQG